MEECFIDLHCHLDYCEDVEGIVKRAKENDVKLILGSGTSFQANKKVLELADKYKEVKACLGQYPVSALKMSEGEVEEEVKFFRKNKDKIIAIGEVGMDFKEASEPKKQAEIFEKFIRLSLELDKPLIVHSRKAEFECVEMLERFGAKKVVMHCFCGKRKIVERIVRNGWSLTVPTNVKNSEQFQKNAQEVPISQLFCETDSPFLHPDKSGNNEPANVVVSYEWVAKMKNISVGEVKTKIFGNFIKLFG